MSAPVHIDEHDRDARLGHSAAVLLREAARREARPVPRLDPDRRVTTVHAHTVGEHDRVLLQSMSLALREAGVAPGDLGVLAPTPRSVTRYGRLLTAYGVPHRSSTAAALPVPEPRAHRESAVSVFSPDDVVPVRDLFVVAGVEGRFRGTHRTWILTLQD